MPDQEYSDGGEDRTHSDPLSPPVKAYIDNQVETAVKRHDESQSRGKKWRNSWRSASPITKGSFIMTAAIAVATIAYAIIAGCQLHTMRQIADDSSRQTQSLIGAATQIQNAGWTFSGAAQGINNAGWSAVGKLQEQANNFKESAEATQNSLIVSEHAYLIPIGANIDNSLRALMLSVINIGHLPSTAGKMTLFEMTVRRGTETDRTVGFPIGEKIEGHWSEWDVPDSTYASPPMLWTPLPELRPRRFFPAKDRGACVRKSVL